MSKASANYTKRYPTFKMTFKFLKDNIYTKLLIGSSLAFIATIIALLTGDKIVSFIILQLFGFSFFYIFIWVLPFSLLILLVHKRRIDLIPIWLLKLSKLSINLELVILTALITLLSLGFILNQFGVLTY